MLRPSLSADYFIIMVHCLSLCNQKTAIHYDQKSCFWNKPLVKTMVEDNSLLLPLTPLSLHYLPKFAI